MRSIASKFVSALAILIVVISVGSCTTARKDNVVGGHHEILALGKQIQLLRFRKLIRELKRQRHF